MNQRLRFSAYILFVVLAALAVCAAQADSQSGASANGPAMSPVASASAPSTEPQFQEHHPRYTLRESDVFDINFDLSPEFNQAAVVVQPDGFVTLRGVGDVKVVGQSVPQLIATLRQAYAKILHDPIISIVLKDFQKPFFSCTTPHRRR